MSLEWCVSSIPRIVSAVVAVVSHLFFRLGDIDVLIGPV